MTKNYSKTTKTTGISLPLSKLDFQKRSISSSISCGAPPVGVRALAVRCRAEQLRQGGAQTDTHTHRVIQCVRELPAPPLSFPSPPKCQRSSRTFPSTQKQLPFTHITAFRVLTFTSQDIVPPPLPEQMSPRRSTLSLSLLSSPAQLLSVYRSGRIPEKTRAWWDAVRNSLAVVLFMVEPERVQRMNRESLTQLRWVAGRLQMSGCTGELVDL